MWKERGRLVDALRRIRGMRPDCRRFVATMTGEIADCFSSRLAGVREIVAAFEAACVGCEARIYLVDGTLVSPTEAVARFREAAASNWHAVATFAAALASPSSGLLIDVGSTTIDIIGIGNGQAQPVGFDDVARLASGELVYTGVERTPVAAVVQELPWRGRLHPVARERFADTQDAWLLLGLPLNPANDTADGRPLDAPSAAARLARMLLLDPEDFTADDAQTAAEFLAQAQTRLVAGCMQQVAERAGGPPHVVVLSGHGGPLAMRCLRSLGWHDGRVVSLEHEAGEAASRVGPAHALARIALGRLP
jgi:(4-(4-[2-(gamma-L-glutamylamino)ethyl]phenoxymethyl)furan-2-yl)methanamine synthase